MTTRAEYDKWLEHNPLTKWMKQNDYPQVRVCAVVGRSQYTVYLWQHGVSIPKEENFKRLIHLTGMEDLREAWNAWKDSLPDIPRFNKDGTIEDDDE